MVVRKADLRRLVLNRWENSIEPLQDHLPPVRVNNPGTHGSVNEWQTKKKGDVLEGDRHLSNWKVERVSLCTPTIHQGRQ